MHRAHQPKQTELPARLRLRLAIQPWWKAFRDQAPQAGQRLGFAALVLLFIVFLSFLGLEMAGGTNFIPAVRTTIPTTTTYLNRALQGDLGLSFAGTSTQSAVPVSEVIVERLPRSLGLLGATLAFSALTGVTLGVLAARGRKHYSLGILLATVAGVSIPSFLAAFLLQMTFITFTRLTGQSLLPVGGFGWDSHLILPVLVLASRPVAQITRITFGAIQETKRQDYIRTARGKGLHDLVILLTHVMRNAAIPIITTIGLSLRFALSSLPIVEFYFGWPGVGATLIKAIAQRDDNLTVALVLCLGLLFLVLNFSLDLIYRAIDPRVAITTGSVGQAQRQSLRESVWGFWEALKSIASGLTPERWLRREALPSLWRRGQEVPPARWTAVEPDIQQIAGARRRAVWKPLVQNIPFVLGSILVFGIMAVVLFGPQLAPNNPFHTQGIVITDGVFTVPPFQPSETYPWGTDALGRGILSLILSGAQQTLTLSILAVIARTVVGVALGSIAGWRQGGLFDRIIQSTADIISAFPTLLLAMILILALGIRRGMAPFIIALCFVGWGGIMQFVRAEVISLKPRPFLESAVAAGATFPQMIGRHILPHLYSGLIPMVALEMSAVLMLLGELGFISIFIGGGTFIDLPSGVLLYSDVPEWGALLSDVRYQARSYPWTAFYPMLAFFLAILSFNLFGEGVRRLVDQGVLFVNRLVNRYSFGLVIIAVLSLSYLRSNSGAIPFYRQQARMFDGQFALGHVANLVAAEMEGRALGTGGMDAGAEYIATAFEAHGLQPAGEAGTFFQERSHAFGRLDGIPTLNIKDGGPLPIFQEDFAPYIGRNISAGKAEAPVRFVAIGRPSAVQQSIGRISYPELDRADYSGEIIIVTSARDANLLTRVRHSGLLVVTDDQTILARQLTLSGRSGMGLDIATGERSGEETPSLWISESLANRMLATSGHSVDSLKAIARDLPVEALYELPLDIEVKLEVQGTLIPKWPVRHVLGFIPGSYDYEFCEDCLARKLIVVMAQYDSPPPGPSTTSYPAANDNASGVAVMLESIRILKETDYQPFKSFLFIAYSGEGLDGGSQVSEPDVLRFLQAKPGFARNFELEAIVQLRGVGGGSGENLEISAGGSLRLAGLFERAARQMRVGVVRTEEPIDFTVIYEEGTSLSAGGQEAPLLRLHWDGWEAQAHLPTDNFEGISETKLEKAGRTLAFSLMVMGRETEY